MTRKIHLFLKDIIDNMEIAESLVKGTDYETFSNRVTAHYTAVRCLEIIGEAAKNVPENTRNKYPEVPWIDMAGMRDKIIHFYFGINLRIVWQTITVVIPKIKPFIIKAVKENPGED